MSDYIELYIDQGEDFSSTIVLKDDITNLYQNVAGYSVRGTLRRSILSSNASGYFVCSVTDAANGEITFNMDSANTSNMKPGTHMFDITYTVDQSTKRLLEGIVIVTPSITK